MRILLCHNFYREFGGEDQVFADEGRLLEAHGHEVLRYTRHNDDLLDMGRWAAVRATLWNRQTLKEVRRLIRQERPDVLHCHNTFPLISPSIYAAAGEAGLPVVQTLHNYRLFCPSGLVLRDGHPCEDCLGKVIPWPGVLHACYRQNRSASAVVAAMLAFHRAKGTWSRAVARYVALSEFSRRKFIAAGLPADRIVTKPNFVDPDPGPGDGAGGYALFVGRIAREKGLDTLLEAWKRVARYVRLKIVGDGPLSADVATAAEQDPRIEYLGRRAGDELPAILGKAACLVFPSACYENCPKTILEAFAKGTPVIASAAGAMTEMVADGRNGLHFHRGDPQDLAAKVEDLLADPVRLAAMRRAARDEYEAKYGGDVNAQRLTAIYRQAIANFHPAISEPAACTTEVSP
jgi:glycosyltransferase involved in cell wall biosynthesis